MIVDLKNLSAPQCAQYLQDAIAPRPICFASTIDKEGHVNLSPFSFFNLFSTNPPVVIFSPSRRVRDNTIKHSLANVQEVPEVAINLVHEELVQQTSLASCDYPKNTNEFIKAGLTAVPASLIKPPLVKESKIKMECEVMEIKSLGTQGGAGNLVICKVLLMHIDDELLDKNHRIDQRRLNLVARLGGNWYCRVWEGSLFEVEKPNTRIGIGVDALPEPIRQSKILTGNNLGQLANASEIPAIDPGFQDDKLRSIWIYFGANPEDMEKELHRYAKELLDKGDTWAAWQVLLTMN